jgi:hypothetical protein
MSFRAWSDISSFAECGDADGDWMGVLGLQVGD